MITVQIIGADKVQKVFARLPIELDHKLIGAANYAAAKPLVEKEKLLAPEGPTGNLVDSIGATRVAFKKANQLGEVRVGPRRNGGYKGFAGHLVEFGTRPRRTRKGANRGIMPKKPFAEPAFRATKNQVEALIQPNLSKSTVRLIKKLLA